MSCRTNYRRKFNKRKTAGFTLLELLLVMAILVVLASLSTLAVLSIQTTSLQKTALLEIRTLKEACKMYKLNVGAFPSNLDELYQNPSGLSRIKWGGPYLDSPISPDPWQRPYVYGADDANDRVTITSNGPDGQAGTQDDVPEPGSEQR
ncbi:MAG: type II secretion system protein GspG [Mariniblastus sp.]